MCPKSPPCWGRERATGYAMALTDFVLMVDQRSYTFATGPVAVKEVLGEDITMEDLGGARVHSQLPGLADMRVRQRRKPFTKFGRSSAIFLRIAWKSLREFRQWMKLSDSMR